MSFELGEKCVIVVGEKNLLIRDERTRKFVNLTPQGWARLLECREQVNAVTEDIQGKKDDALHCVSCSNPFCFKGKKGKGRVLATALLTRELEVSRSALQSRKWQLIGMS